jgi:hypothetical protein
MAMSMSISMAISINGDVGAGVGDSDIIFANRIPGRILISHSHLDVVAG